MRKLMNNELVTSLLLIVLVFSIFIGVVTAMENLDIQSPRNAEIIRIAKADCEQRGGLAYC